jgi:hypothetical protein
MAWAVRCLAARSNRRGGVSLHRTQKRGETRPGSSRSTQTLPTVIVTVSEGKRLSKCYERTASTRAIRRIRGSWVLGRGDAKGDAVEDLKDEEKVHWE